MRTNLYYFSTTIRYSLGLATNDELRNFLAHHSRNNGEVHLPYDSTILINRVLSNGVAALVAENTSKILKTGDQIIKYFVLFVPDLKILAKCPLLIAIKNYLENAISTVNMISKGENSSLLDVVKQITFLDFNKVAI